MSSQDRKPVKASAHVPSAPRTHVRQIPVTYVRPLKAGRPLVHQSPAPKNNPR